MPLQRNVYLSPKPKYKNQLDMNRLVKMNNNDDNLQYWMCGVVFYWFLAYWWSGLIYLLEAVEWEVLCFMKLRLWKWKWKSEYHDVVIVI